MAEDKYSHRERIERIMASEKTDRMAASIWRHFYHRESTPGNLAAAMLEFQKKYDWDFMKINPRASYHVEDWGCELEWSTDEFTKHTKTKFAVKEIADWDKIDILPVTSPILADHLKTISLIKKDSDPNLPLLMTIFNPLGIARYLIGSTARLMEHLKIEESKVCEALERITATYEIFIKECLNAGADGIFYATLEFASSETMSLKQYNKICRPLDVRLIKATGTEALNILHVCHSNNYLAELTDYSVKLINWESANPTNMNLDAFLQKFPDKVAIAGLDDKGWLWHSQPDEIKNEISRLKHKYQNDRLIFGPGCAIDPQVPGTNLQAVRNNL
ncbi:MAG: uroporphyrinogen decarboxylase family protein [Candidatus Zixiibacteriota bacterium]